MARRRIPTEEEEKAEYEKQILMIKRQTLQSLWDWYLSENKPNEAKQTRYVVQPDNHHHFFAGEWNAYVVWDPTTPWALDGIEVVTVHIHDFDGRIIVELITISRERDRATLVAALRSLGSTSTIKGEAAEAEGGESKIPRTRKAP